MGKSAWQIISPARLSHVSDASKYPLLWQTLRELMLVGGVTFAYFLTRGLIRGETITAFAHARQLLTIEQTLHLSPEKALQTMALQPQWLMQAANLFYIFGHLPVLIGVGLWLYLAHPQAYRRFRTAFLLSALLGLSIYVVFPVAPPRFLPGFVDTLKAAGFNVDGSAVGPFYNPYAAMPSLHVGWALLAGSALWSYAHSRWLRAAGVLLPLLMAFAVFITGNHYLLDVLAGMTVVLIALLCSNYWYSWRGKRQAGRETTNVAVLEAVPEKPVAVSL